MHDHAEHAEQSAPSKCGKCNRPMSAPLVCDFCHALNPVAAVTDYFTLLGLPRQYELDENELHRKFVALNRHAHPDFHGGETEDVQQLSLKLSAAINDAYRTLKDPSSRASYLLELFGGKSSAEDKTVPEGFLGTMMMMQEEMADAKASGDAKELQRLAGVLRTQHEGLLRRIAGLFAEYQESLACEAVRKDLLEEIRTQLNAVSYVRKLRSQVEQGREV
jgi:molecular chaperone HscB